MAYAGRLQRRRPVPSEGSTGATLVVVKEPTGRSGRHHRRLCQFPVECSDYANGRVSSSELAGLAGLMGQRMSLVSVVCEAIVDPKGKARTSGLGTELGSRLESHHDQNSWFARRPAQDT